jgi:hypothetical protein
MAFRATAANRSNRVVQNWTLPRRPSVCFGGCPTLRGTSKGSDEFPPLIQETNTEKSEQLRGRRDLLRTTGFYFFFLAAASISACIRSKVG